MDVTLVSRVIFCSGFKAASSSSSEESGVSGDVLSSQKAAFTIKIILNPFTALDIALI